jgi:hypothetical protein
MRLDVEKQIEEHEKKLYEFIEQKAIDEVSLFCHYELQLILIENVIEKEKQFIRKKINPKIDKLLEKHAPYHFSVSRFETNFCLFNDACNSSRAHRCGAPRNVEFGSLISYKEFEEAGFEKKFTKRVIDKFIYLGKIQQKKVMGGFKYFVLDKYSIIDKIKYTKKAVGVAFCGLQHEKENDWIHDQFSKKEITNMFEAIKSQIF